MLKKLFNGNRFVSAFITLIILSGFLLMWEIGVRSESLDPFFYSSPTVVWGVLINLFSSGEIYPHMIITFKEAFLGFVFGTVLGVVFAFVLGKFKVIADILDPIIVAIYGMPKLALGPLFILWFGLGIKSKIILAALMVFFQVFFTTYSGFKNVDINLIKTTRMFGASELQVMKKIILPSCFPWIVTGIRVGIANAMMGAIVGEFMGSYGGLGWLVQNSSQSFDIATLLAAIFILMIIMVTMDYLLKYFESRLIKWKPQID